MPKLLFITFIDFGIMKSGSSVRPQRIYEAFKELGYDVDLLSGLQNRKRERWSRVFKKYLEIRKKLPDFCYIEPPSGPFFNFCDHLLLLYLKYKKVPIGIFYRDAYWKFAKWWPVKGAKAFFLRLMHRFDLFIFKKTCKIIYFPTKSMAEYFDLPRKSTLPPGGVNFITKPHGITGKAIYVGGVSKRYGTDILLSAFEILNEVQNNNIELILVCRDTADKELFDKFLGKQWLKIIRASGDSELAPLYEQSDIALFTGRRDIYMDFAMPVKILEYMSYGLPVITTDCYEAALFVEKYEIGVVSHDNAEDLAQKVALLYKSPDLIYKYKENVAVSLNESNLWVHRARQVTDDLLS